MTAPHLAAGRQDTYAAALRRAVWAAESKAQL